MDELSNLPIEILECICGHLPAVSRVALSKTSSRLRRVVRRIEENKPELSIFLKLRYRETYCTNQGEEEYDGTLSSVISYFCCTGVLKEGSNIDEDYFDDDDDSTLEDCQYLLNRNCNIKEFSLRVTGGEKWREPVFENGYERPVLNYLELNQMLTSFMGVAARSSMFVSKTKISLNVACVDVSTMDTYDGSELRTRSPYFRCANQMNIFFAECLPLAEYHIGVCGDEAFKFITSNPARLRNITVELQYTDYEIYELYEKEPPVALESLVGFLKSCLSGEFPTDYGTGYEPRLPTKCRLLVY